MSQLYLFFWIFIIPIVFQLSIISPFKHHQIPILEAGPFDVFSLLKPPKSRGGTWKPLWCLASAAQGTWAMESWRWGWGYKDLVNQNGNQNGNQNSELTNDWMMIYWCFNGDFWDLASKYEDFSCGKLKSWGVFIAYIPWYMYPYLGWCKMTPKWLVNGMNHDWVYYIFVIISFLTQMRPESC